MMTKMEIREHPRSKKTEIVRAVLRDGEPKVETVARIWILRPTRGEGTAYVAVLTWTDDGAGVWSYGSASGGGYDKVTAALAGCRVGQFVLGDWDEDLPTLRDLLREQGWRAFGDISY